MASNRVLNINQIVSDSKQSSESKVQYRSLDTFFDTVYTSTSLSSKFWYFFIIFSLAVANSSDATEILFISFTLTNPEFQSKILLGGSGGVVAASVFSGMLIGGSFVGAISDRYGRKPTLLFGLLINALGGAASAMAPNVEFLIVMRFIAGIGIGASVPPLFTLVSELSPPHKRGEFVTYVASFWMIGSLYVAVVAMIILDKMEANWRLFALACTLPSFLAFFMVMFIVPESPRFLAVHGRQREATVAANVLACRMGISNFQLMRGNLRLEEINFHFQSFSKGEESDVSEVYMSNTLKVLQENVLKLYSPHMLRSTLSMHLIWFSLSFGTYGLIIWINSIFLAINPKSVYVNAIIFAGASLPGNILSALLMDWIGRKFMLALSMFFSAISLGFFAMFSSEQFKSPAGVIICACSFQAFSTSAWNSIDVLSSEIFPTQIRSSGLGSCTAIGRIGAMVAQPINGFLIKSPTILLAVGGLTMFVGGVTPLTCEIGDLTGMPLKDDADMKHSIVNSLDEHGIESSFIDEDGHMLT